MVFIFLYFLCTLHGTNEREKKWELYSPMELRVTFYIAYPPPPSPPYSHGTNSLGALVYIVSTTGVGQYP